MFYSSDAEELEELLLLLSLSLLLLSLLSDSSADLLGYFTGRLFTFSSACLGGSIDCFGMSFGI